VKRGHLSDRELEEIQDRTRRLWNKQVAQDETELRASLGEKCTDVVRDFHVVDGGAQ